MLFWASVPVLRRYNHSFQKFVANMMIASAVVQCSSACMIFANSPMPWNSVASVPDHGWKWKKNCWGGRPSSRLSGYWADLSHSESITASLTSCNILARDVQSQQCAITTITTMCNHNTVILSQSRLRLAAIQQNSQHNGLELAANACCIVLTGVVHGVQLQFQGLTSACGVLCSNLMLEFEH